MYSATIDINDPFGGNNSLNQAFPEAGGPIQIFAPGFRNAYDVVIMENGRRGLFFGNLPCRFKYLNKYNDYVRHTSSSSIRFVVIEHS